MTRLKQVMNTLNHFRWYAWRSQGAQQFQYKVGLALAEAELQRLIWQASDGVEQPAEYN